MQDRVDAIKVEADRGLILGEFALIPEIKNTTLFVGFKMPTITLYDRKTNPNDHIIAFEDHMDIFNLNDDQRCKVFMVTLKKVAKRWYWWQALFTLGSS